MHQCTNCQAVLPVNAQFCRACGTSVEESQTHSAEPDEAVTDVEGSEATAQPQAAVAEALPTLRTRRMHAKSSISAFPQAPWLPQELEEEENTATEQDASSLAAIQLPLTPPVETVQDVQDARQEQETANEPEIPTQTSLAQMEEAGDPFAIDEIDTVAMPTTAPEAAPTISDSRPPYPPPVLPPLTQEKVATSSNDDLTASPAFPITMPAENPVAPADAPAFSVPAPEKRSTPRPQLPQPTTKKRASRASILVISVIIVLIVLAGGIGVFTLTRQHASTGASAQCSTQQANCTNGTPVITPGKPTHLVFSGAVAGTMSIFAKPRCQSATSGSLRTLTVNLSGTINDRLYNFSFVIEHYNGPNTYSNTANNTTILFDVPGESTVNGWGNSTPTDTGSITVERGEQAGSISYTLSGVGTKANTQIQASGNWTCGN